MKPTFLILLFLLCSSFSFGQGENNNWYFGDKAGLNFDTSPPTVLNNSSMNTSGCGATISNSRGQLLFYSDGTKVWNRDHKIMPNGDSISGWAGISRGEIIVQDVSKPYLYYLFICDYSNFIYSKRGLYYSLIDMRLDSGRGDIIKKNFKISNTPYAELITVIEHQNGIDKWLVVRHEPGPANELVKYYSFLVDSNGVSQMPIVSETGKINFGHGCLKASPSGEFLIASSADNPYSDVELSNFDRGTGIVSNTKVIETGIRCRDVEFSPNNRMMYISDYHSGIYQYDISDTNLNEIKYSKTKITGNTTIMGMQLGPDGRIYISKQFNNTLDIISKPNEIGTKCSYSVNYIYLGNMVPAVFVNLYHRYNDISPLYLVKNTCQGDKTEFIYNHYDSMLIDSVYWDFDDPSSGLDNHSVFLSPNHKFSSSGKYDVKVYIYYYAGIDTVMLDVEIFDYFNFSLGADTFICGNERIRYEINGAWGHSFLWNDNSTQYYRNIKDSGTHWLRVDNHGCKTYDTMYVEKFALFDFKDNLKDTFSCEGDTFYQNIGIGAESYSWSNGVTDSIGVFTQSGTYYVDATIGKCTSSDSIKIDFHPKPLFELETDTTICSTDSITLAGTGNVAHLWNTTDTNQRITVKSQGQYILTQSNEYCQWSDTIQVAVQQQPSLHIGNDTVVCIGAKVIMGATIPNGIQYTWNNRGDGTPKITTDSQSTYSVIAFDGVCRAYDTVFVGVYSPQGIELGNDSSLCEGTQTLLNAAIARGKYLWNDGNQSGQRIINTTGTYQVTVTDSVCQYSDEITLTFLTPPILDLGLDTILCQDEIHEVNINPQWESVLWDDGNTQYNRVFTMPGTYNVTTQYLNCEEDDELTVAYHDPLPELNLGDDQDVCDPLFFPLKVDYTGYYPIVWNTGETENSIRVTQTGDYIVSTQPHRCGQASDTVHITFLREDCKLHIPNAFSPNGDGLNETFMPIAYNLDLELMQIYTRWGELIYEGTAPWDGTYQGEVLPNGVYMYYIIYYREVRGGRHKTSTYGSVTLLK